MKRNEKSAIKRDEIVDKVIAMLNHLDFKDATVRMICEAAEISVGTFYHYFSEKNDLVTEILGRIDNYLAAQVLPILNSEDEIENMIKFGKGFAKYTNGVGNATGSIISTADFPLPNTEDGILAERRRMLYTIPKEIMVRGQQKGQIARDLDVNETIDLLVISLRGHSLEWSRRSRIYSIEDKVTQFMMLFTRMIRK
jgi:AcrR family transcriptional regulator